LGQKAKKLIIMVIIAVSVISYHPVFSVSVGPLSEVEAEYAAKKASGQGTVSAAGIKAEGSQEPVTGTGVETGKIQGTETGTGAGERDRQNLSSRGDSADRGDVSSISQAEESVWYCSKIPMKKEHQKLLWEQSKKNGVDYIDMLAVIALESNFNEKAVSSNGRYKGYFQISTLHGKNLSATLGTKNDPLDGAVNIIWGTAMFGWIMNDKRVQSLEGEDKFNAALSIFNRGSGGYDRYGIKESYVSMFRKKREMILSYFASK